MGQCGCNHISANICLFCSAPFKNINVLTVKLKLMHHHKWGTSFEGVLVIWQVVCSLFLQGFKHKSAPASFTFLLKEEFTPWVECWNYEQQMCVIKCLRIENDCISSTVCSVLSSVFLIQATWSRLFFRPEPKLAIEIVLWRLLTSPVSWQRLPVYTNMRAPWAQDTIYENLCFVLFWSRS